MNQWSRQIVAFRSSFCLIHFCFKNDDDDDDDTPTTLFFSFIIFFAHFASPRIGALKHTKWDKWVLFCILEKFKYRYEIVIICVLCKCLTGRTRAKNLFCPLRLIKIGVVAYLGRNYQSIFYVYKVKKNF